MEYFLDDVYILWRRYGPSVICLCDCVNVMRIERRNFKCQRMKKKFGMIAYALILAEIRNATAVLSTRSDHRFDVVVKLHIISVRFT